MNSAITATENYADIQAQQAETNANAYTDSRINTLVLDFGGLPDRVDALEARVSGLDRRIDKQGAMTSAMTTMAASAAGVRGDNRIAAGVGTSGGESALSVGYQRAFGERAVFTLGGSFSSDEKSADMGVGFGW